jgi:hypothetical protein
MGDAEYMYANGLDPFMRLSSGGGLEEWPGGINPMYKDGGKKVKRSSVSSGRSTKKRFKKYQGSFSSVIYEHDGEVYVLTGKEKVPRLGDLYLYTGDPDEDKVAFGKGHAINEWPELRVATDDDIKSSSDRYVNKCFQCGDTVDSEIEESCNSCDWLICDCGACGCDYDG